MHTFYDKVFHKLNCMKIRNQLLIIYLISVMLPVLLLGTYLVSSTRNLVLKQQITNISVENVRIVNVLRELTEIVANVSDTINYDTQLKSIISTQYPDQGSFIRACMNYNLLDSYIKNYAGIASIQLYVENQTIINNMHFIKETDDIKATVWFQRASKSWELFWQPMNDSNGNTYMCFIRKILVNNGAYAILVISVRPSYLNSMVEDEQFHTVAAINKGTIILSTDIENVGQDISHVIPSDDNLNSNMINYNGKNTLAVSNIFHPSESGDSIEVITLNDVALKRTNDVIYICCLILLIALVIPFIMILIFSNVFSTRFIMLRGVMNKVAKGDLDAVANVSGKDEISELYSDLNVMIESIRKLIKEVYQEKLLKERLINRQQKIEFKMLASQINPHFLYNTLETIRMKVLGNGEKEAANVIKLLGKSMRRVLEIKDELVTLDSELEFIKYYLEIQKFRFGDRVAYKININENVNTKEYFILPLLLQPIVENAFVHGLEDEGRNGNISINLNIINDRLEILIGDNGKGMTDIECASLIKKMKDANDSSAKNSIGLYNVYQRITLYYGQKYGVDIKSQFGVGTKVYVYLPADGKGVRKDETVNR